MALTWFEQKTLGLFVKSGGVFSRPLFGGLGHVFMLHRVLPQEERERYPLNSGLAITPEKLEEHILWFKQMDYQFLSLDELSELLESGKKPKKRFVLFTFDDGYLDNFTFGLPVLEKYGIPFTVYVTTCFPNKNAFPWWYLLEEKLKDPGELRIEGESIESTFSWQSEEEGRALYPELASMIKKMDNPKNRPVLKKLLETNRSSEVWNFSKAADWHELRTYSHHPLVTIGAHTMNHYCLLGLSLEEATTEIVGSKTELETQLGIEIQHFAYPFGSLNDAGEREFRLTKQAGFRTAVLNHPGNIFLTTKKEIFSLPRYPLGEQTDQGKLDEISTGITHFGSNGTKRLIN